MIRRHYITSDDVAGVSLLERMRLVSTRPLGAFESGGYWKGFWAGVFWVVFAQVAAICCAWILR
jgi:hypothetical protein